MAAYVAEPCRIAYIIIKYNVLINTKSACLYLKKHLYLIKHPLSTLKCEMALFMNMV